MTLTISGPLALSSKSAWAAWRSAALALAIGALAWGGVFWAEITAAIRVWIESTAFNHCFLVLPVAIYLAWQRRAAIITARPNPLPALAFMALPVAFCWFVAERLGIMEGRQLLAMLELQILCLAVLGPRTWAVLAAPLLYLFFLIPVGEFLTPFLQQFTAHFINTGLNALGIVNFTDNVTIQIPEGTFFVAEACAGLRFLIASIAFGTLYACTIYRSPIRRALFIGLSALVPILANGVRALAIVAVAHWFGNQNAIYTDHVFYGWLLFSIVTFLLIVIGLPFRDRFESSSTGEPTGSVRYAGKAVFCVVLVVVLCAAAPRLFATYLDRWSSEKPALMVDQFSTLPGCVAVQPPADFSAQALHLTAGDNLLRSYRCGGDLFVLALQGFSSRLGARPVFSGLKPALLPGWEMLDTRTLSVGTGGLEQRWSISEFASENRREIVASAIWVRGRPAWGLEGRMRQALNSFTGAEVPTIIARVDYRSSAPAIAGRQAINGFLEKIPQASRAVAQ